MNNIKENTVEKIWLKEYPSGVPAEVDLTEFASLKDILEKAASVLPICRLIPIWA